MEISTNSDLIIIDDEHELNLAANAPLIFEGIKYPSIVHAFGASKTHDPHLKLGLIPLSAYDARWVSRNFNYIPQWDDLKFGIMRRLLDIRFDTHPHLKELLISTRNSSIKVVGEFSYKYDFIKYSEFPIEHLLITLRHQYTN